MNKLLELFLDGMVLGASITLLSIALGKGLKNRSKDYPPINEDEKDY